MMITWITLTAMFSLIFAIHKYMLRSIFSDVYHVSNSHSPTVDQ
jgi:hypothetical protein